MDRKMLIFGIAMLVLLPFLWLPSMLLPDRESVESRQLERETECRNLVVVACEQGDLEWATALASYWTGINPGANEPRQIGIVLQSTLSKEGKLEAVARIARGPGPSE